MRNIANDLSSEIKDQLDLEQKVRKEKFEELAKMFKLQQTQIKQAHDRQNYRGKNMPMQIQMQSNVISMEYQKSPDKLTLDSGVKTSKYPENSLFEELKAHNEQINKKLINDVKRQMIRERAQIEKMIMEQNIHIMRHGMKSFMDLRNSKFNDERYNSRYSETKYTNDYRNIASL